MRCPCACSLAYRPVSREKSSRPVSREKRISVMPRVKTSQSALVGWGEWWQQDELSPPSIVHGFANAMGRGGREKLVGRGGSGVESLPAPRDLNGSNTPSAELGVRDATASASWRKKIKTKK